MKIKKTPPKRITPPPLALRELLRTLSQCTSDAQLSETLSSIREWTFPKADLYHFVPILNRFDTLLETILAQSRRPTGAEGSGVAAMEDVQKSSASSALSTAGGTSQESVASSSTTGTADNKKESEKSAAVPVVPLLFSDANRKLLLGILHFSRLLQENSTNRNLYNSYEHLNNLLLTTDMDVLEETLALMLRPAQRLSAQRSLRSSMAMDQARVAAIVHAWGPKEQGYRLSNMVTPGESAASPPAHSIKFQFYRSLNNSLTGAAASDTVASLSSPTSANQKNSGGGLGGLVVVQVEPSARQSPVEQFHALVAQYAVPNEQQPALLHHIRVVHHLRSLDDRLKLVRIRCLSIAVLIHLLNEGQAHSQIFLSEPTLVTDLADLLQIDRNTPWSVQTCGLYVIEALTQYRGKLGEVLAALNASANHGIFMFILRKVVSDLDQEHVAYPSEFIEALFSLVAVLLMTQTGGNMVITGGLIPILVQALQNARSTQTKTVIRCLAILDNALHGFGTSFNTFAEANGIEVVVTRIESEFNNCMKDGSTMMEVASPKSPVTAGPAEVIPFDRANLLKGLLKFLWHIMQQSGATDRVRNLIEGALPELLRGMITNQRLFGSAIYALAINIMATFIHNEPQSFNVLNEKSLPAEFLKSMKAYLPPAAELLSAIPHAIGALCLNTAGLDLVKEHDPFPSYFAIFSSPEHFRVLLDEDVASILGNGMDELVRHHPALKDHVMKALISAIEQIVSLKVDIPADQQHFYSTNLHFAKLGEVSTDVKMVDPETTKAEEVREPVPVQCMEIVARFLESFFDNAHHCKEFLSLGGPALLFRFYRCGNLPHDFASSSASYSLSHLFRIMTDTNSGEVLEKLLQELSISYEGASKVLDFHENTSLLAKYVDIDETKAQEAAAVFQSLVVVHTHVGLFSDVYSSPVFPNAKTSQDIVQLFAQEAGQKAIAQLCHFYRVCALESLYFKTCIPRAWIHSKPKKPIPGTGKKETAVSAGPAIPPSTSASAVVTQTDASKSAGSKEPEKEKILTADPNDRRVKNTRYFKYLLSQTTAFIVPILKGLSKILLIRRADAAQRKSAKLVAEAIAKGLCAHITWDRVPSELSVQKYHFLHICAALVHTAIVDERNNNALLTIIAVAFCEASGLDLFATMLDKLIFDGLQLYQQKAELLSAPSPEATEKLTNLEEILVKFHGALEDLLKVYLLLVNSKTLHDSTHTQNLMPKERTPFLDTPATSPQDADSFDPYQFLRTCREKIGKTIGSLWDNSKFLESCPASCLRVVMQIMSHILKADGEAKELPSTASSMIGLALAEGRTDESHLQRLLNLGFPRGTAANSGNNVLRAAEYLALDGAGTANTGRADAGEASASARNDEEDEPTDAVSDDGNEEYEDVDEDDVDNAEDDAEKKPKRKNSAMQLDLSTSGAKADGPKDTTAEALKQLRQDLKSRIIIGGLELLEKKPEIVFDLKDLCAQLFSSKDEMTALWDLLWSNLKVPELLQMYLQAGEGHLALNSRMHFLSLLGADIKLQSQVFERIGGSFSLFLQAAEKYIKSSEEGHPAWLEAVLFLTETLLGVVARKIAEDQGKSVPYALSDRDQQALNTMLLGLMTNQKKVEIGLIHSCLRLFVLLTRKHELATQFLASGGIFALIESKRRYNFRGQASLIALVLRHVMETGAVLKALLEREIVNWMGFPRSRIADIPSFVKNFLAAASRDRPAFLEAVKRVCRLTNAEYTIKQQITLIKQPELEMDNPTEADLERLSRIDYISELHRVLTKETESVVHSFMDALLASPIRKDMVLSDPSDDASAKKINMESLHFRCFLMQILVEIFTAYPPSKLFVLTYSPATGVEHGLSGAHKFVGRLLTEMIPYPNIIASKTSIEGDAKSVMDESDWACELVAVLCKADTEAKLKEGGGYAACLPIDVDFSPVQRTVVDGLCVCLQEAVNSKDSIAKKYGKFHAYADLITSVLTAKSSIPFGQADTTSESSLALATMMLGKSFIPLMTNVLGDLDANFPDIRIVVNAILRSLENLARLGNKISRTSPLSATSTPVQSPISSLVYDYQGRAAEIPPLMPAADSNSDNFIRDSALGMYSAPAGRDTDEDSEYSSDEDMDDDDDGDMDDDMMEEEPDDFTDMSEDSMSADEENSGDEAEMDVIVRPVPYDDENETDDSDADNRMDDDDRDSSSSSDGDDDHDDMLHGGPDIEIIDEMAGEEDAEAEEWSDVDEDPEEDDEDPDEDEEDPDGDVNSADDPEEAMEAMFADMYGADFDPEGGQHVIHRTGGNRRNRRHRAFEFGIPDHMEIHVSDGMGPPFMIDDFFAADSAFPRGGLFMNDASQDNIWQHPLMNRANVGNLAAQSSSNLPSTDTLASRGAETGHRGGHNPFQELGAGHALQLLEQVLNSAAAGGHGHYRIELPGSLHSAARARQNGSGSGSREPASDSTALLPVRTSDRLNQDARLLGAPVSEQDSSVIADEIVKILNPIAVEAERREKEKEEKKKKEREEKEAARRAEEEKARQAELEKQREKEAAEAAMHVDSTNEEAPAAATGTTAATAQPSEPSAPSTVTIHGTTIDLANSGIDPTFLEALPEDLRAEVLAQHFRDQMRTGGNLPTDISEEFLDALPEDIREEVLQQEMMEREIQERARANANARPAVVPPVFGGAAPIPVLPHWPFPLGGDVAPVMRTAKKEDKEAEEKANAAAQREPSQLMDKAGISEIVKFLFLPQPVTRNYMFPLMVNLCENAKSRADLLSLLVNIVQECLMMETTRASSSSKGKARLSSVLRRSSLLQSVASSLISTNGIESFSNVAIHRCLELCMELVSKNASVISFFLSETDSTNANLATRTPKKGKHGKQQQQQQRYPIVHLLSFMEKPNFLKNASLMDDLTQLIAAIVQPLSKPIMSTTAPTASGEEPTAAVITDRPIEGADTTGASLASLT